MLFTIRCRYYIIIQKYLQINKSNKIFNKNSIKSIIKSMATEKIGARNLIIMLMIFFSRPKFMIIDKC